MGSFIIHKYKMAASFIFCILSSFCCLGSVLSAKVAGFSSMAAGSHYFIIRKTMEELSSRGHEVNFHVINRELPLEPLWPDLISTTICKLPGPFFFQKNILKPVSSSRFPASPRFCALAVCHLLLLFIKIDSTINGTRYCSRRSDSRAGRSDDVELVKS